MFSKKFLFAVVAGIVMLFSIAPAQTTDTKAFQLALIAPVQVFPQEKSVTGIRINLIYGSNKSVTGLDWGLVNRTTGDGSMGAQVGFLGLANSDFGGYQGNLINVVQGDLHGLQWGFVNYSHYANGFQFGVVNYASTMKGLQIGLINIIGSGGAFPIFPIVNWSF